MASRQRKFPGIKGRRPDKKYARGVRAKVKVVKVQTSSLYGKFGLGPGHLDDSDVFPGTA